MGGRLYVRFYTHECMGVYTLCLTDICPPSPVSFASPVTVGAITLLSFLLVQRPQIIPIIANWAEVSVSENNSVGVQCGPLRTTLMTCVHAHTQATKRNTQKAHSRPGDTVLLTFMRQFLSPWISKQCEWHWESTAECLIQSIIPQQPEGHHPHLFRQDRLG